VLPNRAWLQSSMKAALASTLAQTLRLPPLGDRAVHRRPLVLGYHRVVDDFAGAADGNIPSMLTSVHMFERHLDWLAKRFRFVSLDDIAAHEAGTVPLTEPVVAITFDDGYRDVYEHAIPRLKQRGIPAAMFVVTDLVETNAWHAHDRLYRLLRKAFERWPTPRCELAGLLSRLDVPPARTLAGRASCSGVLSTVTAMLAHLSHDELERVMTGLEEMVGCPGIAPPPVVTWAMLREMRAAGFTIGSHTCAHVSLPTESPTSIHEQLVDSKRTLERELGEPVRHFAYPGGQFTPAVVAQVVEAGYACAYTACAHGDPQRRAATIERLLLSESSSVDAAGQFSPSILGCQVYDLWPPAWRCERAHGS
jgi:peptidoglycan/xylan/chitin deacetylase (PgdA/CDA1 family)